MVAHHIAFPAEFDGLQRVNVSDVENQVFEQQTGQHWESAFYGDYQARWIEAFVWTNPIKGVDPGFEGAAILRSGELHAGELSLTSVKGGVPYACENVSQVPEDAGAMCWWVDGSTMGFVVSIAPLPNIPPVALPQPSPSLLRGVLVITENLRAAISG